VIGIGLTEAKKNQFLCLNNYHIQQFEHQNLKQFDLAHGDWVQETNEH
jgi:hypothetical protein